MNAVAKFLTGAAATALMAMASHSWLNMGASFVDRLESDARTALGNAGGAAMNVALTREPALTRVAVLSGEADAATRERLLAAVRAVPGIADARWADDGSATTATATAPAETPATAAAVDQCQQTVNAAIAANPAIQFRTGSAYISPASARVVDAIATALTPCAGTKIEVGGHTDARGNPAANQALSQARSEAVVAALVAKGVPAERLVARGFGSSQPAVSGAGAAADAANRRTSFTISSDAAPAPAATPGA